MAEQMQAVQHIAEKSIDLIVQYSFEALGAMLLLVAGWIGARVIGGLVKRSLERYGVDVTIAKFLVQLVKLAIYALAFIMALSKFGFNIAPLVAGLSVVGFGTSFALQGPLSNYAAGATLIFTKPFKVGDIIEVVNVTGEVQDMALARTVIKTVDGTVIVVPNKHIIGEVIHNYSHHKWLEFNVGISYDADVTRALKILEDILRTEPRVVPEHGLRVGIQNFGDSSINIEAAARCPQADYWAVLYDVNHRIHDQFKAAGIVIPFPQRDVHIRSGTVTPA